MADVNTVSDRMVTTNGGSVRTRALLAAATPFALLFAFLFVAAGFQPRLRWTLAMVWRPMELSGTWFSGVAMPVLGADDVFRTGAVVNPVYPIVGWTLIAAWLLAVRRTRLGDLGPGLHAVIAFVWIFLGFCGLAWAGRGV